ncbi:SubName: Full=Uncharacterized protein {ECO:0000313/EMBL:CCA68068.1} [Serendipita indica DSM 11827]|nr:SubName: Full=Uncharacterized protein {ECO:0000313/EMBL:CCA68068.1} [Serendipita indica DSM 11827]
MAHGFLTRPFDSVEDVASLKTQVHWVHLDGMNGAMAVFAKFIMQSLKTSADITTLSVNTTSSTLIHEVFNIGRQLPMLRHLSIAAACSISSFWARLENTFPNIVVLRLSSIRAEAEDVFSLGRLELLEVRDLTTSLNRVKLPSLRHLFIHNSPRLIVSIHNELRFQLTTILYSEYPGQFSSSVYMTSIDTWWDAGDLKLLETSDYDLATCSRKIISLAANHPLEHLVVNLHLDFRRNSYRTTASLLHALGGYPRLRRLSVDVQGLTSFERMRLRLTCSLRGIAWTPLPQVPNPSPRSFVDTGRAIIDRWLEHHRLKRSIDG